MTSRRPLDVKTALLYSPDMSLLNVRLSRDDARLAAELRDDGIPISTLVREAIRREHARRHGARATRRRPSELVDEIIAAVPVSGRRQARGLDLSDRASVRKAIMRALTASGSRASR